MRQQVRLRKTGKPVSDSFSQVDQVALARLCATSVQMRHLNDRMCGSIVMPGMDAYPAARDGKGMSPWDKGNALAVFMCELASDVAKALLWTKEFSWGFSARSGRHSTAAYSSNAEVIIDLTNVDQLEMIDEELVRVGPGVNFGRLNKYLMQKRRHIPTGNCDEVCVGGYVMGGGYGYTSRQFGMQCDNLIEATLILADGQRVTASDKVNPDLFWAIRGGTGNQFGIVVEYIYRTIPMEEIWGFVYTWGKEHAAKAMHVAQECFGKETGLDIGYTGNLTTIPQDDGSHKPVYMFSGTCVKGREVGLAALEPILSIGSYDTLLDEPGFYYHINDAVEGKLPGPPPVEGMHEIKSSAYIKDGMSLETWQEFFDLFAKGAIEINPYNLIVLEAYGGAINKIAPLNTAFIHRDTLMDIYVDAFWSASGSSDNTLGSFDDNQRWINDINRFLHEHWNGHYYQNYPQRNMPNFRWEYWGDAFPTLLFVKNKFDPNNRFSYEQSITPYPTDDPRVCRSDADSLFSDPTFSVDVAYNTED